MEKKISINSFGAKKNTKHIKVHVGAADSGLCLSPLFDILIPLAGKYCRSHASDIFYDWYVLKSNIEDGSIVSGSWLFGFRDDGVDHAAYVLAKANNEPSYGKFEKLYHEIYRMDIDVPEGKDGGINFDLYKVSIPEVKGASV